MSKIILDLCGGTGAWSKPYKDAGYDVRVITLPEHDVKTYIPPENVYGVLAAPPCTMFSLARTTPKIPRDLIMGMNPVNACMRIIFQCNPVFWCLENPVGLLRKWMGKPQLYFNPCDYGDSYLKKSALWGKFKNPKENKVNPIEIKGTEKSADSWLKLQGYKLNHKNRKELRSITPQGFAKAFYKANR